MQLNIKKKEEEELYLVRIQPLPYFRKGKLCLRRAETLRVTATSPNHAGHKARLRKATYIHTCNWKVLSVRPYYQ